MGRAFRELLFALVLGFHNAWEQDEASLEELSVRFRATYRESMDHALERPARCFFWGESSLLN